MQMEKRTESRAELLSAQSSINWKVFLNLPLVLSLCPHFFVKSQVSSRCVVGFLSREGADSTAGGFEPAHQAAPKVQH